MNINKAIRKQKKSYNRFMLSMSFIFFILPIFLIIYEKYYAFYFAYLVLIEVLIIFSIIMRKNNYNLKFKYDKYKLKIKEGIFNKEISVLCDKVVFIHIEQVEEDFNIYLICSSKFRSKKFTEINLEFLKKHPYIAYYYYKIKVQYPEKQYFYTEISKGGFLKYQLLDILYGTCVYAICSDDTLEKIKLYRSQLENKK